MQVNLTPDVESFRVACASVIDKNPGPVPARAREDGAGHAGVTAMRTR